MKILISGGTGLVGKALGKALSAKGHQLYVLTRNPEASKLYTPYPHTPIYWDATKNSPPSDVMNKMDGIINLAGVGIADQRWTGNYKKMLFNSRVIGTQNLVRAANDHGANIKFFISTSATGIYKNGLQEPQTEDAEASQGFLGKLCVAWESPIHNFLDDHIRKVILRIGVVLSEKGGALEKIVPPIQGGYGGCLGNGRQLMSWIDIDDLVNLFVLAAEESIQGIFNAVAPTPASNKDLTLGVAQRLGKKPGPSVPGFALKIAIGEFAKTLLESQNISGQKVLDQGFQFKYPTLSSSLEKRVSPLAPSEKVHTFEQWIPKPQSEVFTFFADAKNLEKITPPHLNFKIENLSTETLQKDSLITYKIKLHGIPIKWVTRIALWEPDKRFADNQESGPYKKWFHTHTFEPLAGGTLMTDRVESIVPMGRLGLAAAGWKVYSDVQGIFRHRHKVITQIFGDASQSL